MRIIKPLIGKIFMENGMFHRFIMSLFDMQSSLTLNL